MKKHSEEAVERAAITLRGITQELKGRGISAVMTLEEQIKALKKECAAKTDALAHCVQWFDAAGYADVPAAMQARAAVDA